MTAFLHVHAAVMLAWVALLSLQVFLIRRKHFALHRRVGAIGVVLAGLVVIMGTLATWRAAVREVSGHTPDATLQLTVLGLELTQMILVASLAALGFLWRRWPDYHKRLLVMATVAMLPNPIVRILQVWNVASIQLVTVVVLDILVLAIVLADARRHGHLHPAFGWGAVAVLGGLHVALFAAPSQAWHSLASRLILA